MWENPHAVNLKAFCTDFKIRVVDIFIQNWYNNITYSCSLHLYREFKMTFEIEKYLDNLPLSTRIAMSRFRLSSHNLNIETGRYKQERIERSMRKCQLCNHQDIEDEYHFLLICPVYSDFRKKKSRSNFVRPSFYKFVCLMGSSDTLVLKKVGRYLVESLKLRKSLV